MKIFFISFGLLFFSIPMMIIGCYILAHFMYWLDENYPRVCDAIPLITLLLAMWFCIYFIAKGVIEKGQP